MKNYNLTELCNEILEDIEVSKEQNEDCVDCTDIQSIGETDIIVQKDKKTEKFRICIGNIALTKEEFDSIEEAVEFIKKNEGYIWSQRAMAYAFNNKSRNLK